MNSRKRTAVITATVFCTVVSVVLVVAMARRAHASTPETCTVNAVLWQTPISGVPNDLLLIACTDGTSYNAYVETAGVGGCFMSANTVKSWEAMAMTALVTGNTLQIWWDVMACPGNAGSRIPSSVTLNLSN